MEFLKSLRNIKERPDIPYLSNDSLFFFHLKPLIDSYINWYYKVSKDGFVERVYILKELKKCEGYRAISVVKKIEGKPLRCCVFIKKDMPVNLLEFITGKRTE